MPGISIIQLVLASLAISTSITAARFNDSPACMGMKKALIVLTRAFWNANA